MQSILTGPMQSVQAIKQTITGASMGLEKKCKDCAEPIERKRLLVLPGADKCSQCAPPLKSEANFQPQLHKPMQDDVGFEAIKSSRLTPAAYQNLDISTTNVEIQKLKVGRKKLVRMKKIKKYECPLCFSVVTAKQIAKEKFTLDCKVCGFSVVYPPN